MNVTAMMTLAPGRADVPTRWPAAPPAIHLVFAGRIADTGRDPVPMMAEAVAMMPRPPQRRTDLGEPARAAQYFQADAIGCHIITVTHDMLAKLSLVGKDLDEYSLETVKMFCDDARRPDSTSPPAASDPDLGSV